MSSAAAVARHLRSPRRTEQLQAVKELDRLASTGTEADCDALVAAGCVPPLLALLEASATLAPAVSALRRLTQKSAGACDACTAAIPTLVELLSVAPNQAPTQAQAADVLGNLAHRSPQRSTAVLAAGGHRALQRLTASSNELVQLTACSALFSLAADASSAAALVGSGAQAALVRVMQTVGCSCSDDSELSCISGLAAAFAAETVGKLCALPQWSEVDDASSAAGAAAAAAVEAGAPAALVRLLWHCPHSRAQECAAGALSTLANYGGAGVHAAIITAGGMSVLTERLSSSAGAIVPGSAAMALVFLVAGSPERCAAVAAIPGLLAHLVQLLDATAEHSSRGAASLLGVLSASSSQLAADIVAAGAAAALAAMLHRPSITSDVLKAASRLVRSLAARGQAAALLAADLDAALQPLAAGSAQAADALEALSRHSSPAVVPPVTPASQPPQRPPRVCAAPGCGAARGLRLCGGCATVRYCSEACSRTHWKEHRADCRRLQAEQAAAAAGVPEKRPA